MNFTYRMHNFELKTYSNSDHIAKIIESTKTFYEIDLLNYMRLMLGEPSTHSLIIDVGANIGNHSVYFGTFVAKTTISVEPNPLVLPILRSNLRSHKGSWTIVEKAVGEFAGFCHISETEESHGNIGMTRVEINSGNATGIEVTTIDDIVINYRREYDKDTKLIAIKIDIEGMELSALKGAKWALDCYKPDIFVEAQNRPALEELVTFLASYGYRAISKWAATPVYHFAYRPSLYTRMRANGLKLSYRLRNLWKRHP